MDYSNICKDIRQYLPIREKRELIQRIINNATDMKLSIISPVTARIYYVLGVVSTYGNCSEDLLDLDLEQAMNIYDDIMSEGYFDEVLKGIPQTEQLELYHLYTSVVEFTNQYAISLVAAFDEMRNGSFDMDSQLQDVLSQIKSREGLEFLDEMKSLNDGSFFDVTN